MRSGIDRLGHPDSRAAAGALTDHQALAAAMQRHGGPVAIAWFDMGAILEQVYPAVPFLGTVLAGQVQWEGMDIDISLLPSLRSLQPHMRPAVTALYRTDEGFIFESRGTVGGSTILMPVTGVFGAFIAPVRHRHEPPPPIHDAQPLPPEDWDAWDDWE